MRTNNFGAQGSFLVVLFAVSCLAIAGCGGKTVEDVSVSHLGLIAKSYDQFRTRNRGQAPQSEAELRDFVTGSNLLTESKIGSFDELLTSDRDFQPLTLLFGKDLIQVEGRTIVGYETQGKDGKRLVAYEGGFVEEHDEAEFSRLIPQP